MLSLAKSTMYDLC